MHPFFFTVALAAVAPVSPPAHWPAVARMLSGRVVDTAGSPLAQVRVTVLDINRTTTTDLDGRYELPAVPTGTYGVSFALVGYAPQVKRVVVRDTDVTLDATLKPTLIELPDLQVTATPLATTSLTSPQPVSVMSGSDVQQHRAASLGETISALPGVHSFSTGSGIGKPVIRGLSSTRVLVLENGQRVESQQWGDEHGPQVEAAEASRIEVIRGPASVLYGSDAIGGVVNVITPPIPDAIGKDAFGRGSVIAAYSTNNEQPDATLRLEGATGGLGGRATFTGRTSDDVGTPTGDLPNTGGNTVNGSGAVGYRGSWGSVSTTYTHRDEKIEIHEDPAEEPDATPFQRIGDDRFSIDANLPAGGSHFDIDLGYERNNRREFEEAGATDVGLGLLSHTYTGDIRLHHAPAVNVSGIIGVSALRNTFDKFGEESLIPSNAYDDFGAYAFEQAELGRWNLSAGARYDHRNLDVDEDEELGVVAQTRKYNSVTGNLGVLYRVAEPVALVLNVGRGYRAPTAFDLFSNGVHEGTVRFERGDSTLKNETSINTDLSLRVQTSNFTAEIGGFANYINNFIFPNPTGVDDPESGFQIFDITQGDARLTGFESALEYHATPWLHLRGTADYVRGQNTTTDLPLPFIPPFRATYGVRLESNRSGWLENAYVSAEGESNARQTNLDPEDFAPAGYTLANFGGGFQLPVGARAVSFDIQLRNAFNKLYASFLSRYKTYAPDPGRNLTVRVSTDF
jgi:iron complex outermembrane receptor protein